MDNNAFRPIIVDHTTIRRRVSALLMHIVDLQELAEIHAIVRARAMYHDDTQPERGCDHCAKTYRGPAVYCSLRCALADA